MWWRKKRNTGPVSGQMMGRFQEIVNNNQLKLAGWLQVQSEKLSVRAKKMIVIVCFLLFASCMVYQVVGGLHRPVLPESGKIIRPELPVPEHPSKKARIEAWRYYLDSLGRTPGGRLKRESLLNIPSTGADSVRK